MGDERIGVGRIAEDAAWAGDQDEFGGVEGGGDLSGDVIGVDVENLALVVGGNRTDNGDCAACEDGLDGFGVDSEDVADLPEIGGALTRRDGGAFCGFDDSAIDARDADRGLILLAACGEKSGLGEAVDRHDGAFEGFGGGDAAAIHKLWFVAEFLGKFGGLGAAAVDKNNLDAEVVEDGDLLDEAGEMGGLLDGFAAAFDDKNFAPVVFEVGEGVAEGLDGGVFHVI